MEDFGSPGVATDEACMRAIERSGISVMMLGYRYGSVAPGLEVSYTELEYEHAQALGHPIFAYLRRDFDGGVVSSTEDDEKKRRLRKLRVTLETEVVVERDQFTTPDDLASRVLRDLDKWATGRLSRPTFRRAPRDIEDAIAYASKRVLRRQGDLLAPRVVLVDLGAATLPKTPSPKAGRLAAKLWTIKRELEESGHQVFIFTELRASDRGARSRFDQRLAQVAASDALVVGFAKDGDDAAVMERFRNAGSARMVWYRDVEPDDSIESERVERFTTDDLSSCAVAVETQDAVERFISERILEAVSGAA